MDHVRAVVLLWLVSAMKQSSDTSYIAILMYVNMVRQDETMLKVLLHGCLPTLAN